MTDVQIQPPSVSTHVWALSSSQYSGGPSCGCYSQRCPANELFVCCTFSGISQKSNSSILWKFTVRARLLTDVHLVARESPRFATRVGQTSIYLWPLFRMNTNEDFHLFLLFRNSLPGSKRCGRLTTEHFSRSSTLSSDNFGGRMMKWDYMNFKMLCFKHTLDHTMLSNSMNIDKNWKHFDQNTHLQTLIPNHTCRNRTNWKWDQFSVWRCIYSLFD